MAITKDIDLVAQELMQEEIVIIPTETVYGLAANFNSEKAINKIFELKQRPKTNPLIVHVSNMNQVDGLVKSFPEKAKLLVEKFWPGPLTLVLEKKDEVLDIVTANQETVAVRMPNHELTLSLIEKTGIPIVAPSANPFTKISPTKVKHVITAYPNNCPLILDGGDCSHGMESTILGFEAEEVILYRFGALSISKIEAVVGKISLKNNNNEKLVTSGMHKKHYSPKTRLLVTNQLEEELLRHGNKEIGLLTFKFTSMASKVKKHIVLSEDGSYELAMKNFYNALHELDKCELDIIVAEQFPNENLGKVINDRLDRAAADFN